MCKEPGFVLGDEKKPGFFLFAPKRKGIPPKKDIREVKTVKHEEIIRKMTLEEKCYMFSGRNFWQTRSVKRVGIPNMTMADGPHGLRKQEGVGDQLGLNHSLPATCFPTAATVANSWDPALAEEIGQCLGEEAAIQDVCVLLGPGLNIKRSPLCGRNFEYFSEDPYLAGKMAAGYIRGIQSSGVSACPKHFAANNTELRRMASDSVVDERTLREIYLTGFEIAVKEGHPKSVMSAYNQVNEVYANENIHLLQEILRDEWGFDGFVVSDWGASNDHVAGVCAGSHMEMPTTGGDSDEELLQAVRDGRISEEMIDRRLDELLDVILSTRAACDEARGRNFDRDAHHAVAQKASQESIVLLKNEGNILPLAKGAKVAVIGEFAQKARYQGVGSSVVNPTKLEHTMDVIQNFDLNVIGFEPGYFCHGLTELSRIQKAVELAKQADYVLLYLGLDEISEAEGLDRAHMKLPQCQIDLLNAVSAVNANIIAIFSAGSSVEMPWLPKCKALVDGYLSGQAGASAMLRVILGEVNPSGKLSETYPIRYEDTPSAPYFPARERTVEYREGLYVGYRYFETAKIPVLFPFGFGLSYTAFEYSGLKINSRGATFTLKNTGKMDGAEVTQLYVSAQCKGVYRPAKELKGFAKVFLKAGESRNVSIPFDDKTFRYFNRKTNRFEREGGNYDILIGASAADIKLKGTMAVLDSGAALPYDMSRLPSYATGKITNISDEEFTILLGHPIPDGHWSKTLQMNDAICQLRGAKSLKARLFYQLITAVLDKRIARGEPDLNMTFIYNMPFRAIGKMSGGVFSQEMCQGIVTMVNGHALAFCQGLGKLVGGFFKQRKIRKKASRMN